MTDFTPLDSLVAEVRALSDERRSGKERARLAYLTDCERIDADLVPRLRAKMVELMEMHGLTKTQLGEVYGTKNRRTILDVLAYGGPEIAVDPAKSAARKAAHDAPNTTNGFEVDSDGKVRVNFEGAQAVTDVNRLDATGDAALVRRLVNETAETDDLVAQFENWVKRHGLG